VESRNATGTSTSVPMPGVARSMNPHQDILLWSLAKDGKVARAELLYIE
jgi:hypothetical protein